jgi:gas vesicle protein
MSKVFSALLAGIAIGILIAPRKGSETRKRLIDAAKDVQDDIHHFIQDSTDSLSSKFESAEDQARDILRKGKKQFSSLE